VFAATGVRVGWAWGQNGHQQDEGNSYAWVLGADGRAKAVANSFRRMKQLTTTCMFSEEKLKNDCGRFTMDSLN
jgi:hypothetical protein